MNRSDAGAECENDSAALSAALQVHRRSGDEYGGWFWPCWRRAAATSCTAEDARKDEES